MFDRDFPPEVLPEVKGSVSPRPRRDPAHGQLRQTRASGGLSVGQPVERHLRRPPSQVPEEEAEDEEQEEREERVPEEELGVWPALASVGVDEEGGDVEGEVVAHQDDPEPKPMNLGDQGCLVGPSGTPLPPS